MGSAALPSVEKKKLWFVITASSVGTLIEWYDFYIFGALATTLADQFFPKSNPTVALLSTLAMFAVGFVVRPLGAIVFGWFGDLVGRKYTFLLTLILMGGSTFAIGLVPGYDSIGILAPSLVLLLRVIQGLALGGEYGGAATYVAEHAPAGKRGFYTSFIQTTASLGLFVSIGVIVGVRAWLGTGEFETWGWRIPFILSAVLVAVSIYIRLRMSESPLFSKIKAEGKTSKNPLKESFVNKENLKLVLIALFGATAGQGVVWYTGQFYAMSFLESTCKVEFTQTRYIIGAAVALGTPLFIYFGWLSDKTGRKVIMLAGMLAAVVLYRPLYKQMYGLADLSGAREIPAAMTITKTTTGMGEGSVTTTTTQRFYAGGDSRVETQIVKAGSGGESSKISIILSGQKFWMMVLLVLIQVVLVTMVYGPIAAFLVELFPTRIRYTSMSLPYHLGNGVFGGLTPFIATSLYEMSKTDSNPTGDPFAGLWYPIVVAGVCFVIGVFLLPNRKSAEVTD
ncbi:MAG TPA: MFS transporter [Chryseosolibacter sp.]|nr:MFS transporter [Chryseosolibacter sp.]